MTGCRPKVKKMHVHLQVVLYLLVKNTITTYSSGTITTDFINDGTGSYRSNLGWNNDAGDENIAFLSNVNNITRWLHGW